jgi:hypothetical protein
MSKDNEGVPENRVTFYRIQGHNHDGENSTLIDFSKYDIGDIIDMSQFRSEVLGTIENNTIRPKSAIIGIGDSVVEVDGSRPEAVAGLAVTSTAHAETPGNILINVSWNSPTGGNAISYTVQLYKSEFGISGSYVSIKSHDTTALSHQFEFVDNGAGDVGSIYYKVKVFALSPAGLRSKIAEATVAPATDSSIPGNITFNDSSTAFDEGVKAAFKGIFVRLNDNTEFDVKQGRGQYEYQVSTTKVAANFTDAANLQADGRANSTFFLVNNLDVRASAGGAKINYYLRVRAIDTSNNAGTWVYYKNTSDGGSSGVGTTTDSAASAINVLDVNGAIDIAANTITANEIYAGTITAQEIFGGTITATELNALLSFESGGNMQSSDYASSGGTTGWKIFGGDNTGSGSAIFEDITARGTIYADSGEIGGVNGWAINTDSIQTKATVSAANTVALSSGGTGTAFFRLGAKTTYSAANTGIWMDPANGLVIGSGTGNFSVNISGVITASAGTIGSWTIGVGKIHSPVDSTPADGGPAITADDIVLGLTNQAVSIGDGRAVMRRYRFALDGNGVGDIKIGIDADAGMNPKYNTAGDMVMWWDESELLTKFSLGNKFLFDGSTLTLTDGITLTSGTPASISNTLYADGTTLKWNGTAVGGGSSNTYGTALTETSGTVNHDDYATAGSYGGVGNYVREVTVNAQGHITGIDIEPESTIAETFYWVVAAGGTAGTTQIGPSTETLTFNGTGATTVTRGTNTIDIASTNTTYSVGDSGLTQKNFTTTLKNKLDGIASGATANAGTVTAVATTGAITGGTIWSTGTIAHSTAAGYKHIPSGGSAGQVLQYASSGTAQWAAAGGGVTDHGALTGLGDNDHTQYSLTSHNHSGVYLTGVAANNALIVSGTNVALNFSAITSGGSIGTGGAIMYDGGFGIPAQTTIHSAVTVGCSSSFSMGNSATWGGYVTLVSGALKIYTSRGVTKDYVTNVEGVDALSRIKALRPVDFYFNNKIEPDNDMARLQKQRGFIAEELAAVDHSYAAWGWLDADGDTIGDPEAEDLTLDDAVPIGFQMHSILSDSVGAMQQLSSQFDSSAVSTTGNAAVYMKAGTGNGLQVHISGDVLTSSSTRTALTDNIVALDPTESLGKIMGLRPVSFTYRPEHIGDGDDSSVTTHKQYGLLAEEAYAVDPWLATFGWVDPDDVGKHTSRIGNTLDSDDAVPVDISVRAIVAQVVAATQSVNQKSIDSLGLAQNAIDYCNDFDAKYLAKLPASQAETALINDLATRLEAAEAKIAALEA